MKTGGGVVERSVAEDPELDILLDEAVNIEHVGAIDSDTVCLAVGTSQSACTYAPVHHQYSKTSFTREQLILYVQCLMCTGTDCFVGFD